jgi:glucose-6-phosphate dehydrogenase-like protein OpcA
MDGVWSAEDTTPSAIEAGVRQLLVERHKDEMLVPARVLNLIAVVDKEWRGEIENRLGRVGRYHPSRTVICAVEPGRTKLDAWATLVTQGELAGSGALSHEQVELAVGERHLPFLGSICDPLVVSDIATLVWAPHGHPEAVDSLLDLAQVVLVDSVEEDDEVAALHRATELAEHAYVVDLAWLRSTPWRERVSSTFDPPELRPLLRELSHIEVRHHPGSGVAALLLVGWLASRLGWQPAALVRQDRTLHGRLGARRQEVTVDLRPERLDVPGLAGVTIETASGRSFSLDRGPGGLVARRRERDGREASWRVLGASRGEAGILGEGVRQALLRDPTYRPALAAAQAMAG